MKVVNLVGDSTYFEFSIRSSYEYKIEVWIVLFDKGKAFCFREKEDNK